MKLLILLFVYYNLIVELIATPLNNQSFDDSKVKFYFWSKDTAEEEVNLNKYGNITKAQTKFLIHGYVDAGNGEDFFFYGPMVQKYIKTGVNVICVDWSFYSRRMYHESVLWLRSIADLVGRFIVALLKKNLATFSDIHIIGHSLGAHVAGFIGKWIQEKNNGQKIGRITGLDPAGPLFHRRPSTDRLSKTDAAKVDTIIGDIFRYGMKDALGQVNFYVWCGAHPLLPSYNHVLVPFYYTFGILKDDLVGKHCECHLQVMTACKDQPTNILGQNVDFKKPGTYYLNVDPIAALKDAKKSMKSAPSSKLKLDIDAIIKNTLNFLKGVKNKIGIKL